MSFCVCVWFRTSVCVVGVLPPRNHRYTCEVAYDRVKQHKKLKGTTIFGHCKYMDHMSFCGHFAANLYKPLVEPVGYEKLNAELVAVRAYRGSIAAV